MAAAAVNAVDRLICAQERPAVWEREAVPLLKCQRSDLILPGATPPVSLRDTSASATAVLQPHAGCQKGRITSSVSGLTEDQIFFFQVSWILWKYLLYRAR